jgi:cytochrome c oxidase assembly protein subunit 15
MMKKPALIYSSRPVATWLFIGVAMLMIQILLGGITRLSGSGLSITEWDVFTGTLPPLNEQQWITEFAKYRQTPQFHLLNFDFTLKDFKFIFFWEWFHRFWARLMGLVFLIPFVIFLLQRRFKTNMVKPLIILFLLGALQGAVGWIMVASGLTGDATYVKPTRLALHFVFALGLLFYTYWFALQLSVGKEKIVRHTPLRKFTLLILGLLFLQLVYGALMAGHKAATAAPTWPDINGSYLPDNMFISPPGFLNLLENKITIHFMHRTLGYLIFILLVGWTVTAFKTSGTPLYNKSKRLPLVLVFLQVVLGILSVISSPRIIPNHWGLFEWMAQLHQLVAMLLLLSLVGMLYLVRPARKQATSR